MHLQKIVNTFHKDHLEKRRAKSVPLDSTPSMVRLIVKPTSLPNESKDNQQKNVLQSASNKATRKVSKVVWFFRTRS